MTLTNHELLSRSVSIRNLINEDLTSGITDSMTLPHTLLESIVKILEDYEKLRVEKGI